MRLLFFIISVTFISQSFAYAGKSSTKYSEFHFKPAATVEYQVSNISGGGVNSNFKTSDFNSQITNFDNIVIGGFFKFNHRIGINLNFVKTNLGNSELQGTSLSQDARLKINQINASGVYLFPVIDSFMEAFGEFGFSNRKNNLKYITSSSDSVVKSSREIVPFIGAGFQIKPFRSVSKVLRFSVQKYSGKIDVLDSSYLTVRAGFVKYF